MWWRCDVMEFVSRWLHHLSESLKRSKTACLYGCWCILGLCSDTAGVRLEIIVHVFRSCEYQTNVRETSSSCFRLQKKNIDYIFETHGRSSSESLWFWMFIQGHSRSSKRRQKTLKLSTRLLQVSTFLNNMKRRTISLRQMKVFKNSLK